MSHIIAIDQGTTGTTCVLIDSKTFKVTDKYNLEYKQHYPKPGWVEHNLNDIWDTVEKTVAHVLKKNNVAGSDIDCIGITNQRETTCAFKKDGTPVAHAIVWQDRRTADVCETYKSSGKEEAVKKATGLPIDPYFSGTKMKWLLENDDNVKKQKANDDLRLGTIDTYLLNRLTSGESFCTEVTNASRTLLMNLNSCSWDPELCDLFGVDQSLLPEIKESFADFGKTKGLSFLPDGIPITGILGDQQAALFGQACFKPGEMKCTYGTGAFMLVNTGEEVVYSNNGLLSTAAYAHNGKTYYALEGSCFIAGAAVQWLRDNLQIIESSPKVEELANKIGSLEEMEHVLFFPFFAGIGSPYWKPNAKATITGLSRDTSNSHLARACLEGMTLSINDLIEAMRADTGLKIENLKVDGGAVANNLLLELQAGFSNLQVVRPKVIETTAYGAALGAAIGSNLFNIEDVHKLWEVDKNVDPNNDHKDYYENKVSLWNDTLKRLYL